MSRFFLEIQYNGTNYHGWQIQENAHSVQAEINKALSIFLQEEILVLGCGRTDTGVHAKHYVAHFDTEILFEENQLVYKLNSLLPKDISCSSVFQVPDKKHARYSATSRTYEYWIIQHKNPFFTDSAYYLPSKLSIDLMNKAADLLIQQTDFSSFSKSRTGTTTNICEISFAKWEMKNDVLIFTITANRFLRNMVRAIVGTLIEIGQEKIPVNSIHKIIASKNRSSAGASVPAHGLYLTEVNYPFLKK
ncbi:MAG: tRNA pseudouridine(38-40) synthase TruA [Bacteroidetes bacterium]|nr:tRNA pseudouridine(38-40) synthase TruA [Bacteroidota bacterium]